MTADKPDTQCDSRFAVSENTNAVRNMLQHVCRGFIVKQDPFHVVQYLSEKIESSQLKIRMSNNMKNFMYSVDRQLRDSEDMDERLEHLRKKVSLSDLAGSETEWPHP